MFHVTCASNIERILAEGIIPQKGDRSLECGEKQEAVYAFPTAEDCNTALGQWLGDWYNDAEEEQGRKISLVIIEFTPDGLKQLPSEVAFEAVFPDRIPPKAFRAIYSERTFSDLVRSAFLEKIA